MDTKPIGFKTEAGYATENAEAIVLLESEETQAAIDICVQSLRGKDVDPLDLEDAREAIGIKLDGLAENLASDKELEKIAKKNRMYDPIQVKYDIVGHFWDKLEKDDEAHTLLEDNPVLLTRALAFAESLIRKNGEPRSSEDPTPVDTIRLVKRLSNMGKIYQKDAENIRLSNQATERDRRFLELLPYAVDYALVKNNALKKNRDRG